MFSTPMESHHENENEFVSAFTYHANKDIIPIRTKDNINLIKEHSNKNFCSTNSKKSLAVKRRWGRRKVVLQARKKSLPVGVDSLYSPITFDSKNTECNATSSKKRKVEDTNCSYNEDHSIITAPAAKKQKTISIRSIQTDGDYPITITTLRSYNPHVPAEDVTPCRYWELMVGMSKETEPLHIDNMMLKDSVKEQEKQNLIQGDQCLLEDHVKESQVLSELVQCVISEDGDFVDIY